MTGAQERTEEATPRKRARAAAQGNGVTSPVAVAALALALAALPVSAAVSGAREWPARLSRVAWQAARAPREPRHALLAALAVSGPAVAIVVAGGAAASGATILSALLCGSIAFAPLAAMPRANRLSPAAHARRLLSASSIAAAAIAIPLVATALVAGIGAAKMLLLSAPLKIPLAGNAAWLLEITRHFWLRAAAGALVVAAVDVAMARRRLASSLRMTQQEVRDERREHEGNPELRARRRAVSSRRTRGLRLRAIAKATAVIANPTHVAVALRYAPPEIDVPQVVSRGAEIAAAAVRSAAHLFGVPVVESAELARALYEHADVDEPIPAECYAAVAAIFALLIRTRGELGGGTDAP